MTTVNITLTKPQAERVCKSLRETIRNIGDAHSVLIGMELIDGKQADDMFAPEMLEILGILQVVRSAVNMTVESCVGGDE